MGQPLEFANVEAGTTLLKVVITFSVARLKVKQIGRDVASVNCYGIAEMPQGRVQLGALTPRRVLEIILFLFFDYALF